MDFVAENIGIIVTIIGIIVGIPSCILFVNTKRNKETKKHVNIDNIINLRNRGLIIHNEELLHEINEVNKYDIIYFPVVPTRKPNMIHVVLCNYLRKLIESGLKVNVFVFDNYYMKLNNKSEQISKSDISTFINCIKGYLDRQNVNIILESQFLKKNTAFNDFLVISKNLKLEDINSIHKEKDYINKDVLFLRYIKPISNMLYLKKTSKKYGFTLSGLDEKPLWDLYNNTSDARYYKLCNLYIPRIRDLEGVFTSVLGSNHISFGDNIADILNKVRTYFVPNRDLDDESYLYFYIEICIFNNNDTINYVLDSDLTVSINTWKTLNNQLNTASDKEKESLINSLSHKIYKVINLK